MKERGRENIRNHNINLHGTEGTLGLTGFYKGKFYRDGEAQTPKEKRKPFTKGTINFNEHRTSL